MATLHETTRGSCSATRAVLRIHVLHDATQLGTPVTSVARGEARLLERGVPRVTALVNAQDGVATAAWEASATR